MSYKFIINKNEYLRNDITGYYHQIYTGFRKAGNPDFLNTLKNTFDSESHNNLVEASYKVIEILQVDIPEIVTNEGLETCMLVCIPRAKSLSSYSSTQLKFIKAIQYSAKNIHGIVDGTDCIIRVKNTKTTHLRNAYNISNDGMDPYPGITAATCIIDKVKIRNQNIILVDDIYTKNVNIDEDCIQALLDNGANKVIFYSIGYTRRI